MTQNTIRVGIIGAGGNTRDRHIPGLREQENVEIIAVVNSSRESSQRVADQFEIPTVYDNWQQLVNAGDLDAVVIGTWPYLHHPATVAALEAGKHVMVEARMAMNLEEARDMHAVSQRNPHLVTQIVPSPFTLHLDNAIKRLVREGYLGEVLAVDIRHHGGAFIDRESPISWRQDADLSGKNIMMMGIWYEALMRWLGEATVISAMGQVNAKLRIDADGNPRSISIPDHLNIAGKMACGAQLSMMFSAITGHNPEQGAWIHGSEGTLRIFNSKLYGGKRSDDSLSEIDIADEEKGSWRVEEEFINAIRGKEAITHTDFATGVKYMAFTEAVTLSMATGEAINLAAL